jgi:ribosomal protein S18 acetylase RimI-like enzyme
MSSQQPAGAEPLSIREVADADWPAIWPFFHRIAAAGETYCYDRDIDARRGRELWMRRSPERTVVAVDGSGAVLGSAKMGPNQAGGGAHVATGAFMVDPARPGRGVGRALCRHALGWARQAGYRAMQFNAVVESNTRAVALWRSLGFEIVGTVPEAFEHPSKGYVGLHVMYRRLDG